MGANRCQQVPMRWLASILFREAVVANGCQWVQMGAKAMIQIPLGAMGAN